MNEYKCKIRFVHHFFSSKYKFPSVYVLFSSEDSLSSGDDEDYDEDPEDAGNGNGEFLITIFKLHFLS